MEEGSGGGGGRKGYDATDSEEVELNCVGGSWTGEKAWKRAREDGGLVMDHGGGGAGAYKRTLYGLGVGIWRG